jgi:uncharacterized protein (TIGR03545 family)/uncharacterized protein (TIGR03546 family)
MIVVRQLFRFFDLIREETTPNRVSAGLVLGFFLGLFPLVSVQTIGLMLLAFSVRVQLPSVVFGALVGAALSQFLDPLFSSVGLFLLKSATLRSTWSSLYHSPLIPFTRFNNSVFFGIHVLSVVVAPVLFLGLSKLLSRYWGLIAARAMYTSFWIRWQSGIVGRHYREYREHEPAKEAAAPAATSRLILLQRRILRVQGTPYFAVAALLVFAVVWFGKEAVLLSRIERVASQMNGARVNVGHLQIKPLRGEIILGDIQIGSPLSPSRNLFQVQRIQMNFLYRPLLRKKLVFENFTVEGVRLDTERAESASLPESDLQQGVAGLLERSATGYYADVRSAMKTNPLKYLGSLNSGLSLNPRVDQLRTQLETLLSLEKQEKEIQTLSGNWESGKLKIPTKEWIQSVRARMEAIDSKDKEEALRALNVLRAEIAGSISAVTEIAASFSESLGNVQRGIASLTPTLDTDVIRVKEALRLPDFSMEDLSPQLFGSTILSALERLAYWIDLSRRRMPLGDATEKMTLVLKETGRGTDVFFANRSGSPELLIPEIKFVADTKQEGGVTGRIFGLTSEPSFYQYPAGADIEIDFPAQKIEKAKLTLAVDHTTYLFKEELTFEAQSLPLTRLALHDTSSLSLLIEQATLALKFNAAFENAQVKAGWNARIDNAQYTVNSRFLPEETALRRLLSPIQSIQLQGGAEGRSDQLHLTVESNLGKVLSAGLRQEFRHALGAIDDNIRRSILDKAEPSRLALASRISQLRQGALQTVNRSLKDLQDLASEADTLKGRLTNPKGKTTASRIRPR